MGLSQKSYQPTYEVKHTLLGCSKLASKLPSTYEELKPIKLRELVTGYIVTSLPMRNETAPAG